LISLSWFVPGAWVFSHATPSTVASSNLRQIIQATLIAAAIDSDQLPQANDVWAYAGELAAKSGLNDATGWVHPVPLREGPNSSRVSTVLNNVSHSLDEAFVACKPIWAVALMPRGTKVTLPARTPVAWTRGLQSNGTWARHSPFGEQGGHIGFISGEVRYYKNINGALLKFGTQLPTSDVSEALPPGARISEYRPSAQEILDWSRTTPSLLKDLYANLTWWRNHPFGLVFLLVGLGAIWRMRMTNEYGTVLMAFLSLCFVFGMGLVAVVLGH
jgi:hypothetical protein